MCAWIVSGETHELLVRSDIRSAASTTIDNPCALQRASPLLKERGGSSRQAILKYILSNYNVGKNPTAVNSRLKLALKSGVKNGTLKQSKGEFYIFSAVLSI